MPLTITSLSDHCRPAARRWSSAALAGRQDLENKPTEPGLGRSGKLIGPATRATRAGNGPDRGRGVVAVPSKGPKSKIHLLFFSDPVEEMPIFRLNFG